MNLISEIFPSLFVSTDCITRILCIVSQIPFCYYVIVVESISSYRVAHCDTLYKSLYQSDVCIFFFSFLFLMTRLSLNSIFVISDRDLLSTVQTLRVYYL